MESRERLLSLSATIAGWATTKRARTIGQILLLAAIVFIALRANSLWSGSHIELGRVDWLAMVVAFFLAAAATAGGGLIWLAILGSLGVRTQRRWVWVFLQAQLGKYIPGSVWQYAGRAAAARSYGIPVRAVGISLPVEFVASGVAGGTMAAFLLGWWGAAIVGAAALVLIAGHRLARGGRPAVRATVLATVLYLPVWLLLGGSFWLCARGLLGVPEQDAAFYMGAFAIAWLAGLVAVYAPGGLGVREAVLVTLLSSRIGAANALVLAAASRLIFILVDVVLAGAAAVALSRGKPQKDIADPA